MSSMQSNSSTNDSFVRPATFFINGFSNVPHVKYYYMFLSLVYVVTVLGNSFIMCIIYLTRRLHTAKYIGVFHLAVSDLCGSSVLVPKIIDIFLFENHDIPYEVCFVNMFFVYYFMNLQSLTLLVLAYDRMVAICFPLRYHVIVTKTAMVMIIVFIWIVSGTYFSVHVGLLNRLSICGSNVVNSYFCDYGPVCRLACNDNSLNLIMGKICFAFLICLPPVLITISYFCIALALLKIAHGVDRIKAIKTCTSHLMLVAVFYVPLLSNNIAAATVPIHPNARIINNSLAQLLPPMLNPIIYTLKTDEVMQSIKELYKRCKVNTVQETNMKCSGIH